MLLAHGSSDSFVPFSQDVELFNTLRRMGNKQVVLLEYVGFDHNVNFATGGDLERCSLESFDHFLKGAPAPAWWADGKSYAQAEAP